MSEAVRPPDKLHRVNGHDASIAASTALLAIHARRHDSHFVGNLLSALASQGFYLGVADRDDVTPREVTARADVARVEHLQQQMGDEDRILELESERAGIVEAGELLFRSTVWPGCAHNDPRHPTNDGCEHCRMRAGALDRWDEAIRTRPASDDCLAPPKEDA